MTAAARIAGTDLTATWHRSADEVPAAEFDGAFFSTSVAWARGWERVRTERVGDHRHLALRGRAGAELVPYFLVERSPQWDAYEVDAGVDPVWPGPVVYSSTLYGEHGGAGGRCAGHIAHAVDAGLELARRWDARALVFANLTTAQVHRWIATRPGGIPVLLDRAYAAALPGSVDGFLDAMRSRVRREFVRQWRRATGAGVRLQTFRGPAMRPLLDDFTRLAAAAAEKHGGNIYGSDIFANLVDVPGAVLLVAEHEGRMVGGFYCFLYRRRFAMMSGGLDYDRIRDLNTYAFLMYESVRYAAAHGADVVDPGRGNFVYKQRHGFTGHDLWALAYPTVPDAGVARRLERMSRGIDAFITRSSGPPVPAPAAL